jgi:hypothetical protein
VRHIDQWAKANPGERKIPRSIGMHRFAVEGIEEERGVMTANQWMWQRPGDFYASLASDDKQKAKDFFAAIPGAIDALETPINTRLVRENFRFLLAAE